jgi:hypothetical protein
LLLRRSVGKRKAFNGRNYAVVEIQTADDMKTDIAFLQVVKHLWVGSRFAACWNNRYR